MKRKEKMHRVLICFIPIVLHCYTAAAQSLVQLLHEAVDDEVMSQFVQTFLLESNSTAVRWQAHELLYSMHKYVRFPRCTCILKFLVCSCAGNHCLEVKSENSHLDSCLICPGLYLLYN